MRALRISRVGEGVLREDGLFRFFALSHTELACVVGGWGLLHVNSPNVVTVSSVVVPEQPSALIAPQGMVPEGGSGMARQA